MGVPIKTSQFAEIYLIGVKTTGTNETNDLLNNDKVTLISENDQKFSVGVEKVGLATNLRLNESMGSRTRTVIGTPIPIFVPGFYDGSITMERATILLQSFKNGVNINPLLAYSAEMYMPDARGIKRVELPGDINGTPLPSDFLSATTTFYYISGREFEYNEKYIPGFLFVVALKDKVLNEVSRNAGLYLAMLRDFSVSYSSENAIILENITALARPLYNSGWYQVLADTFNTGASFGYIYSDPHKV